MVKRLLTRIIGFFVVIALAAMIVLAFLQIILRNFFASGISWADVTVRHLVLWVGFFGAVLAAVQDRHISLDVFSRILPEKAKKYIRSAIYLGSSAVCFILTYASYKFVASERAMGGMLFGGIPVWCAQVVIPVTFGLVGVLFILRASPASSEVERQNESRSQR